MCRSIGPGAPAPAGIAEPGFQQAETRGVRPSSPATGEPSVVTALGEPAIRAVTLGMTTVRLNEFVRGKRGVTRARGQRRRRAPRRSSRRATRVEARPLQGLKSPAFWRCTRDWTPGREALPAITRDNPLPGCPDNWRFPPRALRSGPSRLPVVPRVAAAVPREREILGGSQFDAAQGALSGTARHDSCRDEATHVCYKVWVLRSTTWCSRSRTNSTVT